MERDQARWQVYGSVDEMPGTATPLGDGLWQIDLAFRGRTGVVAAFLLDDGEEAALIECGPASTVPALMGGVLRAGVDPARLRHLLLSHIHLDHGGAAGSLAEAFPELTVHVHPVGAPHLVDPAILLASAGRLYGDRMDDLWGETLPVPAARVAALADGERLSVAGRELVAHFTPGHASHHVVYWAPEEGTAFTGDAGGVRMAGTGYVCPPAPPPDLDPEAWAASVETMRALGARRLCLTHGEPVEDVAAHLDQLMPNLDALRALALAALREGADGGRLTALIHDHVAARLGDAPPGALENLEWATPSYLAAAGLRRLLVKRGEVVGSG